MLLLDYQNVLIQNVLTERFSGFALPQPPQLPPITKARQANVSRMAAALPP